MNDNALVECCNCDWKGPISQLGRSLELTPDLNLRVDVGGSVPAGECPQCSALAYLADDAPVSVLTEWMVLVQAPGGLGRVTGFWTLHAFPEDAGKAAKDAGTPYYWARRTEIYANERGTRTEVTMRRHEIREGLGQ